MSETLKFRKYTGAFRKNSDGRTVLFEQNAASVSMKEAEKFSLEDSLRDPEIPLPVLRHSFGTSGSEEDYSILDNYRSMNDRERELAVCINSDGTLKNLDYHQLRIPVDSRSYSHPVGPIHAGIIEPGHFRFYVTGEYIQMLHIRLGYQKRNLYRFLKNRSALQVMPVIEAAASDSTVSYATAGAEIFEQSAGISISQDMNLFRKVLLEVERIAIHVGDIGAIAGDIGWYPLLGICATDRGIPLGVMESLTGSRFGKSAIFPGQMKINRNLTKDDLQRLSGRVKEVYDRVSREIRRTLLSTTVRERLHDCGLISKTQVYENGFIGMAARCTGAVQDLRLSQKIYTETGLTLWNEEHSDQLTGDAWSRLYLRYVEFQNSCEWLMKVIPSLNVNISPEEGFSILKRKDFQPGLYFSSVEGWRGPVLIALEISKEGKVLDSYIRDPSVLNWHALELAVRGELIGDFPLNNKSFNLSYIGVDL
ncbi:MAG TPA: metal (Ni/Fe) hydrogenase large subunit [Leptospiraceae bacterium]|nr:metal (Ni/Fe) hydrogenase large subunit [Leptospiraceae bacterium]